MTALPDTGRPSISRWRPRRLITAAAKASPRVSEPLRRLSDPGRCGRFQPCAEAEHPRRQRRIGDQREIALDRGLGVRALPGDEDLRFAAQHQRRAIELGAGPGEFGLELADAARPDPAADQVKDGGYGREQHQRQDGEASDIGLRGRHVERQPGRRVEGLRDVLGARQRARKQVKREARRRPDRARAVEPSRPPADSGALRPAEPPQQIASSRTWRRRLALAGPSADPVSLRQEGPNQLSLGLRKVCRKVVNQ